MKLYFTEAQGKVNSEECANISVIALDSTISSCVLKTLQEVKYGKRQLNGPKRMMGVNSVPDDCLPRGGGICCCNRKCLVSTEQLK